MWNSRFHDVKQAFKNIRLFSTNSCWDFPDLLLHCEVDSVTLLQNLHQRLGVVLRGFLQGDSLGQTVSHHTPRVFLDPLIRHREQAAFPHSLTCESKWGVKKSIQLNKSLGWLLLTVKYSEDFFHHLPQDKDVGLGFGWGSGFAVVSIFTQFAQVTFLFFGMGVGCGRTLQTRRPWSQRTSDHFQ